MTLQALLSDRHRIDASFRTLLLGHDESALLALVEDLTAYIASRQKVLAPVVTRELDSGSSSALVRAESRMRVLLLRLGATYKLGSSRMDATIAELGTIATEHFAIEERIVPALARALSAKDAAALGAAVRAEHGATAASFRRIIAHKNAASVQAPAA